ncbi:hypothetical protein LDENG_00284560 [Lucifuga dentata]|nr:hypothetical protein LDENG_00284560 [Lucifuga dentata]
MEEVFVLLVLLAGITHAFLPVTDTSCNMVQNSSMCSVSVGGSVYIQLMANATGHQVRCSKLLPSGSTGKEFVFSLKKEKVIIQEELGNRTEFFISNGTFKITNVEAADSGQYAVLVFDPNGVRLSTKTFEVQVVQENILPIIIISASAACLTLIVVVVSCCAYRRTRRFKQPAAA